MLECRENHLWRNEDEFSVGHVKFEIVIREVLQSVGYSSLRLRKGARAGIHIADLTKLRWIIPDEHGLESKGFGGPEGLQISSVWEVGRGCGF